MRPARGLILPLLTLAFAGAARAGEVTTTLHGKVAQITGPAATALGTHGVTVGATVTTTWTLESTTPGDSTSSPAYTFYHQAIKSLSVSIGSWQATQSLPPLLADLDFVQVGDESPGGGIGDTYLLADLLVDTDLILTGANPGATCASLFVFADADAKTISDEGVIQDPSKFLVGTGAIAGATSSIAIAWDTQPGGGGGQSVGPGLAQRGQLKAAGNFGSKLLKIFGKSASQPPDADPFGAKEAAAVDKAGEKFNQQFLAAVNKALKKGGTAPLPASSQAEAADSLQEDVGALEASLLTGANPDDKFDRQLRGKLFKAAAVQCSADMTAFSVHAFKPNPTKLADKLDKAEDALLKKVATALAAAEKKGVVYTGPSGAEIAAAVFAMADEFNQLTQGIAAAVQAADEHARTMTGVGVLQTP
ncbi:MAG TPA: hypothetical protein VFY71_06155 [Planctomycetota bacterium]|nr:hypothetical protein [Planctomycetota bacterium]